MSEELRLYSFQNMYLPGVHCGPQGIHSAIDMARKYDHSYYGCKNVGVSFYRDWADNHKTVIVVNGGGHSHLVELDKFLNCEQNPYPWMSFRESEEALNEAMTNVCIVVPERVFNFEKNSPKTPNSIKGNFCRFVEKYEKQFTPFEIELAKRVISCRLMS